MWREWQVGFGLISEGKKEGEDLSRVIGEGGMELGLSLK
jgi:hypothetical protein